MFQINTPALNKRNCCTTKKDNYFIKMWMFELKLAIENQGVAKYGICALLQYLGNEFKNVSCATANRYTNKKSC